MRRLPIYFLIDVSESMVGEPIKYVENGMRDIILELRSDPYALETAWVSVITFAGKAKTLVPLTELYQFYPPEFPIGSGTSLGSALDYLMQDIDTNVVKTTAEQKGDWKPIVFLFTDGCPTDTPDRSIERWIAKYCGRTNLIVISIGNSIDPALFGRLTENIIRFNGADAPSYKAFFKWVTASIRTSSQSVAEKHDDGLALPAVDGITLEKVDPGRSEKVDENFAVFLGKCQTTGKRYLMKYAKQACGPDCLEETKPNAYHLVGAYAIDGDAYDSLSVEGSSSQTINTGNLYGAPICPCCGNQLGFVTCDCGNVFCVGESRKNTCPWCGTTGTLGEGTTDVSRTRG